MQILVVGTVALDDIKTPFGEKKNVLGGSASHFSNAASVLSLIQISAVIGKDFPSKYLNYFKKKGIDTAGIVTSDEETFHWAGHYEYDMNVAHTDDTKLGVLSTFNPILTEQQKNAPYLFLANIDPDLQMKVVKQMKNPQFIGLDSMNYWISSKADSLWKVLKKVDTVFLNDAEIRELAGEASLIKAARIIQKKGPKLVLVKKGEHGVLAVSKDFTFVASAYPTENVKDPTGAGDSFAGGFVSYLVSKLVNHPGTEMTESMVKQAVIWGSAAASFCVEGFSTSGLENISIEQIRERCHAIHDLTVFEKHD